MRITLMMGLRFKVLVLKFLMAILEIRLTEIGVWSKGVRPGHEDDPFAVLMVDGKKWVDDAQTILDQES